MTKHKGLPVAGYQAQSDLLIDLVNRNKANEERQLRLMEIDLKAAEAPVDPRWMAIAKTHLEQAFMAWNRAIFQPRRIGLPEDAVRNEEKAEG